MKTTLEMPDHLFRKVKSFAAIRGLSLKRFIREALEEKLRRAGQGTPGNEAPWMRLAGSLKNRGRDLRRVERAIARECERIEPEGWE